MSDCEPTDRLEQLWLAILPGRPPFDFAYINLYDEAYRFWMRYQIAMRKEIGLPIESINSDDFLRHNFVNVLVYENSVVAMINSTLLDFLSPAAANHSYINAYFGHGFIDTILGLGFSRMATLENIVCHTEWRSKRIGVSLGAVVMGVALKKIVETGCDAAFGAARSDAPTAKISYDFGARAIKEGLVFHGKPTDLAIIVLAEIRSHPSSDVNRLINRLWARRLDATAGGNKFAR